jgi:hypothetical protein
LTIYNSRNTNNSRNESKIGAPNAVGAPTKARILAKLVRPATTCKEADNSMDTINIRDDSSTSREASNNHHGRQHQQEDLTNRTLAVVWRTAAETI